MKRSHPSTRSIARAARTYILCMSAIVGSSAPATAQRAEPPCPGADSTEPGSALCSVDVANPDLVRLADSSPDLTPLRGIAYFLVLGSLIWLGLILRTFYATWLIQQRLQSRSSGRLEAARELHDTLLQSVHGLVLRFHYAVEELDELHPARPALRLALQRADQMIVEDRERAENLGLEPDRGLALTEKIGQAARSLHLDLGGPIDVEESGRRRPLSRLVEAEVWQICQRCLSVACTGEISPSPKLSIFYGDKYFALRCSQSPCGDGVGLSHENPAHAPIELRTLVEVARELGLPFRWRDRANGGFAVELRFPAAIAYEGPSSGWGQMFQKPASLEAVTESGLPGSADHRTAGRSAKGRGTNRS
ncbi:Histidine kinase [Bryocella elongata]|uniref:Histidine kinase n=1 Tax=Bryocella elongata TaxID=863522 RepID=A0A1H5VUC5_9BACT|nr:Histidine kinase [Bryocella elongata]